MANSEYFIRQAFAGDLKELRRIYDNAKLYMDKNGNPNQWAAGYPADSVILDDIAKGDLYLICEAEEGAAHAVFAMIEGVDETYLEIDGKWLNDRPYIAIHRVASDGFFSRAVSKAVNFTHSRHSGADIRIDTHKDNLPMQNALLQCGFIYCGIIRLKNGDPRLAYQLTN